MFQLTASRAAHVGLAGALAVFAVWLGLAIPRQFDTARHAAAARAVVTAPDVVTIQLPQNPAGRADGTTGEFQYRRRTWLSVVSLHGLRPVAGRERYLVFLQSYGGWVLAGAARGDAHGDAVVRFGADPWPPHVFEVVVMRDADDATSYPHGTTILHWIDPKAILAGLRTYNPNSPPP